MGLVRGGWGHCGRAGFIFRTIHYRMNQEQINQFVGEFLEEQDQREFHPIDDHGCYLMEVTHVDKTPKVFYATPFARLRCGF